MWTLVRNVAFLKEVRESYRLYVLQYDVIIFAKLAVWKFLYIHKISVFDKEMTLGHVLCQHPKQ